MILRRIEMLPTEMVMNQKINDTLTILYYIVIFRLNVEIGCDIYRYYKKKVLKSDTVY